MPKATLKIIVGSDLHGSLPSLPPCDLLLLVGDVFPWQDHRLEYQRSWQRDVFFPWLKHQPAEKKVLVAGNHDFLWEREPPRGDFDYLQDSALEVGGWRIWGTPWTPPRPGNDRRWAFRLPEKKLAKKFAKIDKRTDILLSHGPPWGLLDWTGNRHAGSMALLEALQRVRPALCLFGHIHESSGSLIYNKTLLLNTTVRDRQRQASSMWTLQLGPESLFWKKNTKK